MPAIDGTVMLHHTDCCHTEATAPAKACQAATPSHAKSCLTALCQTPAKSKLVQAKL